MKSTAILDLMVKDHSKIVLLLNQIEKNLESNKLDLMKAYDEFTWTLEKHIFTEEKAIFTSYYPTNIKTGYKMVPELIKQHNEILNIADNMRANLIKNKPIDFESFKQTLLDHKTFEEETLYPKLDLELEKSQKQEIVSRIAEMV